MPLFLGWWRSGAVKPVCFTRPSLQFTSYNIILHDFTIHYNLQSEENVKRVFHKNHLAIYNSHYFTFTLQFIIRGKCKIVCFTKTSLPVSTNQRLKQWSVGHITLCYITLCYVTLHCVMLHYIVLCYIALCYIMFLTYNLKLHYNM